MLESVQASTTMGDEPYASVSAYCEPGDFPTGGGAVSEAETMVDVRNSAPARTDGVWTGWRAGFMDPTAVHDSVFV